MMGRTIALACLLMLDSEGSRRITHENISRWIETLVGFIVRDIWTC